MDNHYQVLEVDPSASQEQIRDQYRLMIQAWHPDKFSSPESKAKAEEKSKQINNAYSVLKDPIKRKEYDRKQDERESREKAEAEKRKREQAEAQKREYEAKTQREANEKAEREQFVARTKTHKGAKEKPPTSSAPAQQSTVSARKSVTGKSSTSILLSFLWKGLALVIFVLFLGGLGVRVFLPTPPITSAVTETALQIPTTTTEIPIITTKMPLATIEVSLAVKEGLLVAEKAKMILISEGEFSMGSDAVVSKDGENPLHKVDLFTYYIDQYEVTNEAYKRCVDVGVYKQPIPSDSSAYYNTHSAYYDAPEFNDYPVMDVNWDMANTYCSWRNARLPTEAEWEKAARGTDGRTYPWGETLDCSFANYSQDNVFCVSGTTKVGSYESGKSPYGVYDMIGNVYEWVNDWYSETYYQNSPLLNPLGPDSGITRTLRGGDGGIDNNARITSRNGLSPDYAFLFIGFRCARSP